MVRIAASTLPSNENKLLDYVKQLQLVGADYVHCDFMDNTLVNKRALSVNLVNQISYSSLLFIDVHLMVNNPQKYFKSLHKAKVNLVTFHFEVMKNNKQIIKAIKTLHQMGLLCGLAINVQTPVEDIVELLPFVDVVLPMSVKIGESGQRFDNSTLKKYETLNALRKENGYTYKIQADGGINESNFVKVVKTGVDIVVMGSAIYNSENKKEFIKGIKNSVK